MYSDKSRSLVLLIAMLVWSLLALVTYALLRGYYYDAHLLAAIVSVRLAFGFSIGVCAGVVVLIAQLFRIPGSQFSSLKAIAYVSAATVTGLAVYNFFEL